MPVSCKGLLCGALLMMLVRCRLVRQGESRVRRSKPWTRLSTRRVRATPQWTHHRGRSGTPVPACRLGNDQRRGSSDASLVGDVFGLSPLDSREWEHPPLSLTQHVVQVVLRYSSRHNHQSTSRLHRRNSRIHCDLADLDASFQYIFSTRILTPTHRPPRIDSHSHVLLLRPITNIPQPFIYPSRHLSLVVPQLRARRRDSLSRFIRRVTIGQRTSRLSQTSLLLRSSSRAVQPLVRRLDLVSPHPCL